jgi:hypothetical protein
MIILAPFSANFLAIDWPIPVPLPVITTFLPIKFEQDFNESFSIDLEQ